MDISAPRASFWSRLGPRLVDPTVLTLPVVFRRLLGREPVVADRPDTDLVAVRAARRFVPLYIGGNRVLRRERHRRWVWIRVAVHVLGITAVMYAIGWGPTLAIGLIFGAVESMRSSGASAPPRPRSS